MEENQTINNKVTVGFGRRGMRLACDVMLILAVLVTGVFTFVFFAVPVTEMGDQRLMGETQHIFEFIWQGDNSIISQIDAIQNRGEGIDEVMGVVNILVESYRLMLLLIPAVVVLITTLINVIRAANYFYKQKSAKLGFVAVQNTISNFSVYVFFGFFGSISGGVGVGEYFIGYQPGIGMTIGTTIGVALIIAVAICRYLMNRNAVDPETDGLNKWIKACGAGIGYISIGIVLTFMRIYGIFSYMFTSLISNTVLNVMGSSNESQLTFTLLNLLVLMTCLYIYSRFQNGAQGAFRYLVCYGEDTSDLKEKEVKRLNKQSSLNFIAVIVLSILSIVAVYFLRTSSQGLVWSVNIYYHLLIIFVISAISQTLLFAFWEKKKKTTN